MTNPRPPRVPIPRTPAPAERPRPRPVPAAQTEQQVLTPVPMHGIPRAAPRPVVPTVPPAPVVPAVPSPLRETMSVPDANQRIALSFTIAGVLTLPVTTRVPRKHADTLIKHALRDLPANIRVGSVEFSAPYEINLATAASEPSEPSDE